MTSLIVFLGVTSLFYLSASYFGGVYIRIARFWYLFCGTDLLLLFLNSFFLRYSLHVEKDHLEKGDKVPYKISIQNATVIPVFRIHAELTSYAGGYLDVSGKDIRDFSLAPGQLWTFEDTVFARIRGVYILGLTRLTLRSWTGILSLDVPIWNRSFYVYPRILDMEESISLNLGAGGSSRDISGTDAEARDFLGLREYRDGESLSRISWSHFLRTGSPWIREFDSPMGSTVHLFLDRRSSGRDPICEDTALEIFFCILKAAVQRGQSIVIHGYPGWEGAVPVTEDDFNAIYRNSLFMKFDDPVFSPPGNMGNNALITISTLPDLELLEDRNLPKGSDALLTVSEAYGGSDAGRIISLIALLERSGHRILDFHNTDSLPEDLRCRLFS